MLSAEVQRNSRSWCCGCHCFSPFCLDVAAGTKVLWVSDVLPLLVIFTSYRWHLEQCLLSYYHVITGFGHTEVGAQYMIHFFGIYLLLKH